MAATRHTSTGTTFLIEQYMPVVTDDRLTQLVHGFSTGPGDGRAVEATAGLITAIGIPADELVLVLLTASSRDQAMALARRAGLRPDRIVAACSADGGRRSSRATTTGERS